MPGGGEEVKGKGASVNKFLQLNNFSSLANEFSRMQRIFLIDFFSYSQFFSFSNTQSSHRKKETAGKPREEEEKCPIRIYCERVRGEIFHE